jgi:hypothetical protein
LKNSDGPDDTARAIGGPLWSGKTGTSLPLLQEAKPQIAIPKRERERRGEERNFFNGELP